MHWLQERKKMHWIVITQSDDAETKCRLMVVWCCRVKIDTIVLLEL